MELSISLYLTGGGRGGPPQLDYSGRVPLRVLLQVHQCGVTAPDHNLATYPICVPDLPQPVFNFSDHLIFGSVIVFLVLVKRARIAGFIICICIECVCGCRLGGGWGGGGGDFLKTSSWF